MSYLLLWSGDIRGMKKARIAATPATGILSNRDESGALVSPDRDAIRVALPYRFRAAWDRVANTLTRDNRKGAPFFWTLRDRRGRYLTTIYAQPLSCAGLS